MEKEQIIQALTRRYATKIFDKNKHVTEEDLLAILEAGRLSPSAYGVESWQFILVKNEGLRKKLRTASYDQPKVTDASHLVVLAYRTDGHVVVDELVGRTAKTQGKTVAELQGFSDMVHGAVTHLGEEGTKTWYKSQTYIPLGIMITTAALLGIDSGPMEGFNAEEVDDILGLKEKNLHATAMLALGYRGEDPYATTPKTRKQFEEIVTILE